MNWKTIMSLLVFVGGLAVTIWSFLYLGPFHIVLSVGIFVMVLAIVLYIKRPRWGYWWSMITGKKHIETYIRHQAQDYDEMNMEPNLKRGRMMEKIAIGLIWIVSLGGQLLMPFVGFEIMAIVAGIAIVSALSLFILKKILGYYEFKEHATNRHVVVEYVDLDGNENELFFEDAKFSARVIVDSKSLVRVLDDVDRQIQTMKTERKVASETALKELPTPIAEEIKKIQELGDKEEELHVAVADRIKASKLVRKFFRVGIEQEVQFDYTDEETVRRAIQDKDEDEKDKKKKKKKDEKDKKKKDMSDPKLKIDDEVAPKRHMVCTLCGETLTKSEKADFYFNCSQCNQDTNLAHVVHGPIYEPHIYTLYPGGELKRRCILVFPVTLNDALDPTAQLRVRFNYESFLATAHYIRAIKLGTLKEVLYDGELIDGIKVDLPEGIATLDSEVPVFVATDFDYAEKRRLAGLQMVKPPRLISDFIRLVKAVVQVSIMGRKLEDKEIEVTKLQESRQRIRALYSAMKIEQDLDKPDIIPPAQPAESVKPPPRQKPLKLLQALAIAIIFLSIGALTTWFMLPAVGWRVLPPASIAALAMQTAYGDAIPVYLLLLFAGGLSGIGILFVERKWLRIFFLGAMCFFLIASLTCAILNPGWLVIT